MQLHTRISFMKNAGGGELRSSAIFKEIRDIGQSDIESSPTNLRHHGNLISVYESE